MKWYLTLFLLVALTRGEMREYAPLLEVPVFPQAQPHTCGPAAFRSVLAYYGVHLTEEELAHLLETDEDSGTELRRIQAAAHRYSLKAELRLSNSLQDLKKHLGQRQLAMISFQAWAEPNQSREKIDYKDTWEHGHYAIVVGLDVHRVYLVDPVIDGLRGFLKIDDFVTRWHDESNELGRLQQHALFFEGTPNPILWTEIH